MRKTTICIGENKAADQLRGHREADQRLCFRLTDSTIPLLLLKNTKFPASNHLLWLYSPVCVRPGQNPKLLVFSRTGSLIRKKVMCSLFDIHHSRRKKIHIFPCRGRMHVASKDQPQRRQSSKKNYSNYVFF